MDVVYDTIIIGAGPAGLSAALYAARARLKVLVLDKSPLSGALGKAGLIENYPGLPAALPGRELLALMRQQAQNFGATILQTTVVGASLDGEIKQVFTTEGLHQGKTVIIATGSMGHAPSLPGEADLLGRGVSYCAACDAAFFTDQDIAVIGSGPEAIEELPLLLKFARRIYLVAPSRSLPAAEIDHLRSSSQVVLKLDHRPRAIIGTNSAEALELLSPTQETEKIPVNGIFVFLQGNRPIIDFLYGAVKITEEGCICTNREDMSTSLPGVFAAGDVTCKRIRQVVLSTAEGCLAALAADRFINQRQQLRSQWS